MEGVTLGFWSDTLAEIVLSIRCLSYTLRYLLEGVLSVCLSICLSVYRSIAATYRSTYSLRYQSSKRISNLLPRNSTQTVVHKIISKPETFPMEFGLHGKDAWVVDP